MFGQVETASPMDKVKTLYDQQIALEAQLIRALQDACPLGTEIVFSYEGERQKGKVIGHGAVKPELRVENIRTRRRYWLALWNLLEEVRYKQ